MQYKETAVSLDTIKRERERERVLFSQISFICVAKNKIDRKKRIDYKAKMRVKKMSICLNSLSFLHACEVIENKDKYA